MLVLRLSQSCWFASSLVPCRVSDEPGLSRPQTPPLSRGARGVGTRLEPGRAITMRALCACVRWDVYMDVQWCNCVYKCMFPAMCLYCSPLGVIRWISINDSTLASVCYTVIYMVRVGLGLIAYGCWRTVVNGLLFDDDWLIDWLPGGVVRIYTAWQLKIRY